MQKDFDSLLQLKFVFEDLMPSFNSMHARVLLALKQNEFLDAKGIWLKAELPRQEVFQVIDFLLEKDLIKKESADGVQGYSLNGLKKVLSRLIALKKQKIDLKKTILNELFFNENRKMLVAR